MNMCTHNRWYTKKKDEQNDDVCVCWQSKHYGGQKVQRPGMAKLLAEESDRHWEEGINALKKHLQIGGVVNSDFTAIFNFGGQVSLMGEWET